MFKKRHSEQESGGSDMTEQFHQQMQCCLSYKLLEEAICNSNFPPCFLHPVFINKMALHLLTLGNSLVHDHCFNNGFYMRMQVTLSKTCKKYLTCNRYLTLCTFDPIVLRMNNILNQQSGASNINQHYSLLSVRYFNFIFPYKPHRRHWLSFSLFSLLFSHTVSLE